MTETEYYAQIEEVIEETANLIRRRSKHLVKKGKIDLAKYGNNKCLANNIMAAMLPGLLRQYEPITAADKRAVVDIYKHLACGMQPEVEK